MVSTVDDYVADLEGEWATKDGKGPLKFIYTEGKGWTAFRFSDGKVLWARVTWDAGAESYKINLNCLNLGWLSGDRINWKNGAAYYKR